MAKRSGSGKLHRSTSTASYPTLAEARLDRRMFLAGFGVAVLGACTESDDEYISDGALVSPDASTDHPVDASLSDGVPPPPDAGPDAATDAGVIDAEEPDADTRHGTP